MADKTGISWTDATWNPTKGCEQISPGCKNCYAKHQAARIVRMAKGKPTKYDRLVKIGPHGDPCWTGEGLLDPEALALPLRWREPRRVFVDSMSDLFWDVFTNEQIAAVFGVMAACPQHTFQVLTKRAKRMREWFEWVAERRRYFETNLEANGGGDARDLEVRICIAELDRGYHVDRKHIDYPAWPLPNVWLGVSVENQAAADERIPELLRTPAAVRFLSCEPLLGPVDLKGWGDHAPTVVDDVPETWDRFAWPEWVPDEQRRQIESFWGASSGRSPRAWLRDHAIQQVPATGARVTCAVSKDGWATVNKMATSGVTGKYLHSWNNIGRIITDDGQVVCASGGSGSGWLSRWLDRDGEYRSKLHWVIAGCESGPGARPCSVEWLRSLRDQCAAAGVPYFLKQAMSPSPAQWMPPNEHGTQHQVMTSGAGSKRKPGGVIELPYLDGVQWNQFPEVRHG